MKTTIARLVSLASLLLGSLLAVVLAIASSLPARAEDKPAAADSTTQSEAKDAAVDEAESSDTAKPAKVKKPNDWLRVRRDDDKKPLALETSIVRFVPQDAEKKDIAVDLIGAVHIGDKAYYDELNKRFADYDVVLYELVAPEGTRIPKGGRKSGGAHPLTAMQTGMQKMLGLAFQLDHIDYTAENFVHADMTPDEMTESMKENGESTSRTILRAIGQAMAQQAAGSQQAGGGDINLLMSMLFTSDPAQRAHQMKLSMADQFENLEGQMFIFEGNNGSTLINLRNKKALEVLDKQLAAGKKKIGIFYGAGHLADFAERLASDYKMDKTSVVWLEAWSLTPPPAKQSNQSPIDEKPEADPASEKKSTSDDDVKEATPDAKDESLPE